MTEVWTESGSGRSADGPCPALLNLMLCRWLVQIVQGWTPTFPSSVHPQRALCTRTTKTRAQPRVSTSNLLSDPSIAYPKLVAPPKRRVWARIVTATWPNHLICAPSDWTMLPMMTFSLIRPTTPNPETETKEIWMLLSQETHHQDPEMRAKRIRKTAMLHSGKSSRV